MAGRRTAALASERLPKGKLFRNLGEQLFPRKRFPRVEEAYDRGNIRRTRPGRLKNQWITEQLRFRWERCPGCRTPPWALIYSLGPPPS